jgi:hypothetical protein
METYSCKISDREIDAMEGDLEQLLKSIKSLPRTIRSPDYTVQQQDIYR